MIERKKHQLSRPSSFYPVHLIFFDTETTRNRTVLRKKTKNKKDIHVTEHKFLFGYYIYTKFSEKRKKFIRRDANFIFNRKEFLKYIIDLANKIKEDKLFVFAHNMQFDYTAIKAYQLKELGWHKTDLTIVEPIRFVVEWTNDKKSIVFIDTMNFFKSSLKKLGDTFGLEKLEVDLSRRDIVYVAEDEGWYKMLKYCQRDVEIIEKAITWMIETLKYHYRVPFAYTLAGLAMNYFRKKTKYRLYIKPEVDEIEEQAYFGGRTEAFKIGWQENIHICDVNSLYPFVMKTYVYPVTLDAVITNPDIKLLIKLKKANIPYIAEINVNCTQPVLPVRNQETGKVIFPIGNFSGTWCSPEINLLDPEEIISVNKILIYKPAPIFKDIIEELYNERLKAKKEGNEVLNLFSKLLMNSMYGKFAQRIIKEYRAPHLDKYIENGVLEILDSDGVKKIRYLDGEAYIREKEKKPSYNSFIAIAAFVTSYARAYLWQNIVKVGEENVLYCDTDSMFLTDKGLDIAEKKKILDEYELGKFKNEGSYDAVDIRGAKDYTLYHKTLHDIYLPVKEKIKGVPKKATQIAENKFIYPKFMSMKEAYNSFKKPKLVQIQIEKILQRKYDKRIILENGDTRPIVL